MKKLLQTMKAFLVIAMLCVGTNVWGQVTTWTYNTTLANNTIGSPFYGSTNGIVSVTFGNSDQASAWGVTRNNNQNRGLANQSTAYSFDAVKTNVPTNGTYMVVTPSKDVKFELVSYASDNVWVYLTDESSNTRTQLSRAKSTITSTANKLLKNHTYYIVGYNSSSTPLDRNFSFRSFTATTYENYTIHYQDGNGTTIKDDVVYSGLYGATVTASESDMASVEYNDKTYYYDSGNESIVLGTGTNEITLVYASQTAATVTVKYWNDAEPAVEIKEATTIDTYVGATDISASGDQLPTYIKYSDVKYKYSSGNTPIATVTGDATIDLVYTEAESYTYTVTDNLGNALASGSAYIGENVTYYVPYYVFKNGRFYEDPNLSVGTRSYGECTISNITANTEVTVTYTEEENTNVVFFSEAESLTDATVKEDSYTHQRMSNGKAGYFASQTAFVTLPAGKYTITSSTRSGTTTFYKGTVGEGTEVGSISSGGSVATATSDEFTLYEPTDIYTSTSNSGSYFDYVIIRKTGNATIPAAITSAGYTTFCSQYALDFSNVEGITAYIVTDSDESNIKMTKIEKAPAETGLVLKGAQGNYNIPVATDYTDSDWPSGKTNYMVKCLEETTVNQSDNGTNYVLVVQEGKVVFAPVHNTSATVDANHAYLYIPNSNADPNAKSLSLSFAEENLTGIKTVSSNFTVIPAKRIENGQLVIEKNGKFYNAAGQLK